jgi:PHD/YefM family antitoxin component YafN of YafNO toxin-antitoxin module
MNTIAAGDIKRRGISAVDDLLARGPVHVIKNNEPEYVVITEERYKELLDAEDEAFNIRIRASLSDVKAGKVTRGSADDLIKELGLED